MKHTKNLIALFAVLCFFFRSSAQQVNYTINGKNLPRQTKNGTVVRLLDRQTWDSIGCATVSKGKFTIEGQTDTVVMGWITDSRHLYFPVVIEPGMTVTLDARNYSISGSPLNDQLCRYTSGYSQYQKMLDDSYDVSSAVKEGSWLYRKAQAAIKICIDTINHFNNITGWSIYNDNADNVVGAYLMYHYLSLFTNNGDYYSDTVSLRRHILDSLYTIASPVVRNYIPNRKEYETSLHQAEVSNGNRFKDFSGVDFSTKKTILLSQFIEGKVAVIDFWASWCGPCRKEIEETLKPLYNKYADKGLVVVGIGVWDEVEKYDKAVKELELTYPLLFDADRNNSTTLYGVQSIPMVFLIDRDGTILGNYRGDELVKAVEKALGVKE